MYVYTFGSMTLESRTADYRHTFSLEKMKYLRGVLVCLLCAKDRSLPRNWLLRLWPSFDLDGRPISSKEKLHRLSQTISKTRLAVPPELLFSQRSGRLTLHPQTLLWWDAEAVLELASRAEKLSSLQDALPLWQEAQNLIDRGMFLSDDISAAWTEEHGIRSLRSQIEKIRQKTMRALAFGDLISKKDLSRVQSYFDRYQNDSEGIEQLLCTSMNQPPSVQMKILEIAKQCQVPARSIAQLQNILQASPIELIVPFDRTAHQNISALEAPQREKHPLFLNSQLCSSLSTLELSSPEEEQEQENILIGATVAQFLSFVYQCKYHGFSLGELQQILDKEITAMSAQQPISRRDALLGALSFMATAVNFPPYKQTFPIEDFLCHAAAGIVANWHLLGGHQYTFIQKTLSRYLPALSQLAKQNKDAAELACQAYLQLGLIAFHTTHIKTRQKYCQQAVIYADMSQTPLLQAAARIHLCCSYYYGNENKAALHAIQEAWPFFSRVSPLLQSCMAMRLAMVLARCYEEHEKVSALIQQACQTFPERAAEDPAYLYSEFTEGNLYFVKGLIFLDTGHLSQASSAMQPLVEQKIPVSPRTLYQVYNYQARIALEEGDKDAMEAYLLKGIEGAISLQSKRRREEAIACYRRAKQVWPQEKTLDSLAIRLLEA
jgi:DNA-binding transcriptional MerR regulator